MKYASLVVTALFGCLLFTLQADSPKDDEAINLLKQAGKHYTDAKIYRIEAESEQTSTSEFSRNWQKTISKAIQGSDNKFLFEVHSANSQSLRVSDGKMEFIYHTAEKEYVKHPTAADGPVIAKNLMFADLEEYHTIKMRDTLAGIAEEYKSAQKLPDETITIHDVQVPCWVIKVTGRDRVKPLKPNETYEETIWIAKSNMTIRKMVEHQHGLKMMGQGIFESTNSTTLYPVAELNSEPADDLFTFTPPQTAKLLEKFSDPFSQESEDLSGKPAPAITLKSPDGKEISLASLRGKPVLLDFWATWCLPCVASMPELHEIYLQTKDKGLVFLSVDEDKTAQAATDFLAQKHDPWPNFHDAGDIKTAFQEAGLPYTVLIDAQGKIVFCKMGYSDASLSDLRAAIAKLGPEFTSVGKAGQK